MKPTDELQIKALRRGEYVYIVRDFSVTEDNLICYSSWNKAANAVKQVLKLRKQDYIITGRPKFKQYWDNPTTGENLFRLTKQTVC